jgi:endogenous inhibitor of DNA gyrase (YacG/DUF329 family)
VSGARCELDPERSALYRYHGGCRCDACVRAHAVSAKTWRDAHRDELNAARRKKREPTLRPCAECGETFLATNPRNTICSKRCRNLRHERRRREAYAAKVERRRERRREQMRALHGETFVDLAYAAKKKRRLERLVLLHVDAPAPQTD